MATTFPKIPRRNRPEVLAPAGNLNTLKTAVDFGADAVYCGGREFGMRARAKNFSMADLAEGVSYAHDRGARVFVTCNVLPTNSEVKDLNAYMAHLAEMDVDALIVSDIGVLMSARQVAPNIELHVSTQAGVTNYQAANAFAELGASRVVLARELPLEAIRDIRRNVSPSLEIEAFVHGAMCMAFSGRCLISQHTTGRDANHGDCAQSCRWQYHVVEEKRPGQFFPIETTDEGTFLFNSQDMNMLAHIDDVLDAGVTSLKIEGRAKGAYYVAATTNAYKTAVGSYLLQRGYEDEEGKELKRFIGDVQEDVVQVNFDDWLLAEPYKVAHRDYCTGFYYPESPASVYVKSGGSINDWRWVGVVEKYDETAGRLYLHSKNKICPGDEVEFLFPGSQPLKLKVPFEGILDENGNAVTEINNHAKTFSIPCHDDIPSGAMIRIKMNRRPRQQRI
ncbi:hypothetical protein HMPREF9306_02130 [Propionimicrobium lymphophilum ACS-093-V-SCH5]|uniref:Peptidase family U32 C-terminal domain-containing protein n=1 Tax=Propionimicrobium lymphophilum ACS-093-V-SCH5 TaxID=883161 RepID=S2VYF0_9ACTN|nr:U32 family peptidase [Propionimicrobium lymphophilum]EPD32558.1 hypothetical protein HMPREF9306_02130 [Propionimicrobium lymphophilum ACS-093-V-SCH5]